MSRTESGVHQTSRRLIEKKRQVIRFEFRAQEKKGCYSPTFDVSSPSRYPTRVGNADEDCPGDILPGSRKGRKRGLADPTRMKENTTTKAGNPPRVGSKTPPNRHTEKSRCRRLRATMLVRFPPSSGSRPAESPTEMIDETRASPPGRCIGIAIRLGANQQQREKAWAMAGGTLKHAACEAEQNATLAPECSSVRRRRLRLVAETFRGSPMGFPGSP